jgi:hypothetical protein
MREFVARAQLHRATLGVPGALLAAQIEAAEIDNPALQQMVAEPAR